MLGKLVRSRLPFRSIFALVSLLERSSASQPCLAKDVLSPAFLPLSTDSNLSCHIAAGLSINKMLDAEALTVAAPSMPPVQPPVSNFASMMSQIAMPSRSVRIKPVLDAPVFAPHEMMQTAAPTIRNTSRLDFQQMPDVSMHSNVCLPSAVRIKPVLQAPDSQQLPQVPIQLEYGQLPPQVTHIERPPKPSRPNLSPQQLLQSLKLWSSSLAKPEIPQLAPTSIMSQAADALSYHSCNIQCVKTTNQIQTELKALQALLDAGFIQPMEFETRRFALQVSSKYALPEVNIPNVDVNRALAPMSSSTNAGSYETAALKQVRVFVSSTFRDMSDEREVLVKSVLPKLARECKKRGITLTSVDLRWGITSEQTNAGNTVNICLSEIDRSQYFLCMLGERYGWAQPSNAPAVDLNSANNAPGQDVLLKKSMQNALSKYPWIRSYASSSVTELEVRHAVLNQIEGPLAQRSLFMLRSAASDDDERLTSLKREISASVRSDAVKHYKLADFGEQVFNSLLNRILADFPEQVINEQELNDPVIIERAPHAAFEESRRRFYIPRPADFQALDSHLASASSKPLVVSAEQGLGKSAFLANFAARYRLSHPERLLITHYVGCTSNSTTLTNVLQRMIGELWKYSNAHDVTGDNKTGENKLEMPVDLAGLNDKFIELLSAAGSRYGGGVTILVDAVNQLSSGLSLDWLPAALPHGVSFILSCPPSSQTYRTLVSKNAIEHRLHPLSPPEREAFVQGFMSLHAKTLKETQLDSLVKSNACSNPLYLKTLLDELRVFGSFEQLDTHIAQCLTAADPTQLYKLVFGRLDKDLAVLTPAGAHAMVVGGILASRSGLTEDELIRMYKLTPATWASVSLALEDLLVESSGSLTFFHDCVREAVTHHYPIARDVATLHRLLATFFESQRPTSADDVNFRRYYEELPFHYEQAQDWTKLQAFLTDTVHFAELSKPLFRFDLYRYWSALPEDMRASAASMLTQALHGLPENGPATVGKRSTTQTKLAQIDAAALFFKDVGQYGPAEDLLKKSVALSPGPTSTLPTDPVGIAAAKASAERLESLGYVLRLAGKYSAASGVYQLSLGMKRKLYAGTDSAALATSINSLAILKRKQGIYDEASKLYHEALEMRKRLFGTVHLDIAQSYNSLGCLFQDQGEYEQATKMLTEAIRQREVLLGNSHPDVAMSLLNLGNTYIDWCRFTEAEPVLDRSLAIYEAIFGPEHPSVALVLNSLAGLHQETGRFETAIPFYVRNLETKLKMIGEKHPDLALAFNDIAVLCSRKDNNDMAEDFFKGALAIRRQVLGENHPDFAQSLQNLGSVYQQQQYYSQALPLFQQALSINIQAFSPSHPNVASSHTSIGGLLQLMGSSRYSESVDHYKKAYNIYLAKLADGKPDSDLALTCNDLAIVYVKMNRHKEAEEMYLESLKHYTGCFGPDHSDVGQALKNLGAFYAGAQAHDKAKATQYLAQSVRVFETSLGSAHPRTIATRELLSRTQASA